MSDVSDEFKFQPSQRKAIETVQNKKSVSLLADGFVVRWGTNTEVNTGEQYGKSS